MDGDGSKQGRWREYVNTYVSRYPTEWLPVSKEGVTGRVFLRRQVAKDRSDKLSLSIYRNIREERGAKREKELRVRVDGGRYKVIYENGSEETMWRERNREERAAVEERVRRRVWEGMSRILDLSAQL